MTNTILIIGESGSGKSTSIRTLDPTTTFIINVIDKPLPFKGVKKKFTKINADATTGNYYATDDYNRIRQLIAIVNKSRPDIKTLIIDDWQYTMGNEFMRRAGEKGYDKFTEIGQHAWKILNDLNQCRDDLDCFVLSHSDLDQNGKAKCKTIGKMLDDKITVEGMFTIVFHSIVIDGKHKFLTQHDGMHIAKSPLGMFSEKYIENDLKSVKEQITNYFNEDIDN